MKQSYKKTNSTISFITYHFVFCPRYRRKIFDIPGFTDRFKTIAFSECKKREIEILLLECGSDYVHLHVNVYPQISIPEIMRTIKYATSSELRNEFKELEKMPSLWTRSYFVSTEETVSQEIIQWYVKTQRTRY